MSIIHICCSNCGKPYNDGSTNWNSSEWRLTTEFGTVILKSELQSKIFDLLWRKQGIKGLTRDRIVEIIYANDLDGGPNPKTISMAMQRLRIIVADAGVFIKRGFSNGEGYTLIFTTPDDARMKIKEQSKNLGCKPKIKGDRYYYYKMYRGLHR